MQLLLWPVTERENLFDNKIWCHKELQVTQKNQDSLESEHCSLDFIVLVVEPTMETKETGGLGEQTLLLFLKQKSVKTRDKGWKSTCGEQFKGKEVRTWKVTQNSWQRTNGGTGSGCREASFLKVNQNSCPQLLWEDQ